MIRKLGVMAVALAMIGASMAATVAGKAARDTSDSPAWTPIGLSILSYPMQIPLADHSVFGVMLNVGYGRVDNVYPLEVGLFNQVLGNMGGVQAGVCNFTEDLYGFQLGIANIGTDVYGFQLGLVNVADRLHGIQIGLINVNAAGTVFFPFLNVGF